MNNADAQESVSRLNQLSDKQREVLDRLILHQTSKEIARELGISHHTVEQRIRLSKEKLGIARRSDLATEYRRLLTVCDKIAYKQFAIDPVALPLPKISGPVERTDPTIEANLQNTADREEKSEKDVTLVPTIFQGRNGTLLKLGMIVAIAAATIIVAIGSLSMLELLSRLLS